MPSFFTSIYLRLQRQCRRVQYLVPPYAPLLYTPGYRRRQLIVEGQASGEIALRDPDQLVIVILSALDGLSRRALYYPEQFKEHFPDAEIILRIFKPQSGL
ncbi:MAG TPA: hypothetical protein VFA09_01975 [Ktedonobacteraceae bacterium]|nr:hypothetical protein [Ktedonobacteraceae bacterium]